jgi:predicted transcriptional regulator
MAVTLETKVLTAHVPLDLAQRVDQLAARFDRSRGWIMKQALEAWVNQEEERSRLTREAMSDIKNGQFVDHETVLAWSASLGTQSALSAPIPVINSSLRKK